MAEFVGRKCTITPQGGSAIAAATSKSFTISNELIDVTSDDDAGFRKLIEDAAGKRSLDMSIEGIFKDKSLLEIVMGSEASLFDTYDILFPAIGTVSGTFGFNSFEVGAPTEEGVTFTASLQSSGTFTFTAV